MFKKVYLILRIMGKNKGESDYDSTFYFKKIFNNKLKLKDLKFIDFWNFFITKNVLIEEKNYIDTVVEKKKKTDIIIYPFSDYLNDKFLSEKENFELKKEEFLKLNYYVNDDIEFEIDEYFEEITYIEYLEYLKNLKSLQNLKNGFFVVGTNLINYEELFASKLHINSFLKLKKLFYLKSYYYDLKLKECLENELSWYEVKIINNLKNKKFDIKEIESIKIQNLILSGNYDEEIFIYNGIKDEFKELVYFFDQVEFIRLLLVFFILGLYDFIILFFEGFTIYGSLRKEKIFFFLNVFLFCFVLFFCLFY